MQESIFLITHIHKTGIQARHYLLDLGGIHITDTEGGRTRLCLIFYQDFVLK